MFLTSEHFNKTGNAVKVLVNSHSTRENMRRKIKENYCPTGSREDRSVARAALNYPLAIINSFIIKTIRSFLYGTRKKNKEDSSVVRASLFFKDQTSTNSVKRQMRDLSHKNWHCTTTRVYQHKIEQDLKPREIKPPNVNQKCVVYSFTCDLCDSDYVGFTARHLHQHKNFAIGKHFSTAHGDASLLKESQFRILKKCQGKFDCLIHEMLFIKQRNPSLNMQTYSIRAKLFV